MKHVWYELVFKLEFSNYTIEHSLEVVRAYTTQMKFETRSMGDEWNGSLKSRDTKLTKVGQRLISGALGSSIPPERRITYIAGIEVGMIDI